MKWRGEFFVNANDVDVNRVVTTSNILRYMQDAANWQMEADGLSYDELFVNRGLAFVLSMIKLSLYTPLYTHEKYTVESWACPSRGMSFQRCYRILRGDRIVAEAISAWALVSVKDKKLHRVTEYGDTYGSDAPLELDLPKRIKIPEDVHMSLVGERTVEYADIDMNGHMNNTRYPDMLCSYLDNMQGKRVISMTIHFKSEAPLSENLKVYRGESDGVYYLRTLRDSGAINVEAEIITEDL